MDKGLRVFVRLIAALHLDLSVEESSDEPEGNVASILVEKKEEDLHPLRERASFQEERAEADLLENGLLGLKWDGFKMQNSEEELLLKANTSLQCFADELLDATFHSGLHSEGQRQLRRKWEQSLNAVEEAKRTEGMDMLE